MDKLRQYLLCVTAAAIVCGIINSFMGKKGTVTTLVKLITGLFLALTMIRPIMTLHISQLISYTDTISQDAQAAAAIGESYAMDEMSAFIKSEVESYILDKATSLGGDVQVDVVLSDTYPYQPEMVYLTGSASPYVKTKLSQLIVDDVGVPKEAQHWNE